MDTRSLGLYGPKAFVTSDVRINLGDNGGEPLVATGHRLQVPMTGRVEEFLTLKDLIAFAITIGVRNDFTESI